MSYLQRVLASIIFVFVTLAIAFIVARSTFPCLLPQTLPGVTEACYQLSEGGPEKKTQHHNLPIVTVAKAIKLKFTNEVFVSGTLVARKESVASAQLSGTKIVEVLANEGDIVKAGQVLARLDRRQLDALLAQSDAALQQADARIAQASSRIRQLDLQISQLDSDLTRAKKLGAKVVSQATIEQQITNLQIAKSKLSMTKSEHTLAQANKAKAVASKRELLIRIEQTEIISPVDGIISQCNAVVGAISGPTRSELFSIVSNMDLDLKADVPSNKLSLIKRGMQASLLLPGHPNHLDSTVRLIAQKVNQSSRMGVVYIAIPSKIKSQLGSFSSGYITVQERSGTGVPTSAIQTDEDGNKFIQIIKNGVVNNSVVETGMKNEGYIEILKGLQESDLMILKATPFFRTGDLVRTQVTTLSDENNGAKQ